VHENIYILLPVIKNFKMVVYSVPVTGTLAAVIRSRQSVVIGQSGHMM